MFEILSTGGDNLWTSGAIFIASAILVWTFGARLAGYADRFARLAHLGGAVVGLVLLGGVTSLPEIATSATAATKGNAELAVNNLVGGVSLQLLMLVIVDFISGPQALSTRVPRPDVMAYAAMNMLMLSLYAGIASIGDYEILNLGIGFGSALIIVAYAGCILSARALDAVPRWRPAAGSAAQIPSESALTPNDTYLKLGALIATSAVMILIGGYLLTTSSEALARQTGLGQSFFGAVFLSGATSLPELSSAIAAVRLGRPQLAIGDILGGNMFNLSLLFLVDVLYRKGPVLSEAGSFEVGAAMLASMMSAIILIGLIDRKDKAVLRMGLGNATAAAVYVGGIILLYFISDHAGAE